MPSALTLKQVDGGPGKVYYPLQLSDVPRLAPGPKELMIKLSAAALNHRDLFVRQKLYPGIALSNPMLADGCGVVVAAGSGASSSLVGKHVVLMPSRGWESDPDGPETSQWAVLGSSNIFPTGMAQEFVAVPEDEAVELPAHLSPIEGAALPLVGLTGWRAFVSKSGNAAAGRNLLVTGIGGGVALQVLQFAVAMGCSVWVTSGDEAKIEKAKQLGARGGVMYKSPSWGKELARLLPGERPWLDAVIDGAGGDIVAQAAKLLKPGGVISIYGMTTGPSMEWTMGAVLRNVELRGSTMGSKKEFREMIDFVREKQIRPVVSRLVKGLDNLEGINSLFGDLKKGRQFGKLVVQIETDADDGLSTKL